MSEDPHQKPEGASSFAAQIGEKAERKLRARRSPQGVWFGLGMMGLIGWSVVVPTLCGAGIGVWLDQHHPAGHPWTLALMIVGLAIGCVNAWYWVDQQDKAMREEPKDANE